MIKKKKYFVSIEKVLEKITNQYGFSEKYLIYKRTRNRNYI